MCLREGLVRKLEGMSDVEEHANELWGALADMALFRIARHQEFVTSEDVLYELEGRAETHDNRAMGPVMTRGAASGWIEEIRCPLCNCLRYQPAKRGVRNQGTIKVWRSLIYRPMAVQRAGLFE